MPRLRVNYTQRPVPFTRGPRALSVALLAFGCAERSPVHVGWPEDLPVASFLVRWDGERLGDIRGPLLSGASSPAREDLTELDEVETYLIGLDEASLRSAMPRLPASFDPASLRLEAEVETCVAGNLLRKGDARERRMALGSVEHRTWRLSIEGSSWVEDSTSPVTSRASVTAPEDPSLCISGGPERFRPFGAEESLLDETRTLAGRPIPTRASPINSRHDVEFLRGAWIDDNTVVVMSHNALFRIERGAPIDDQPRGYLALAEMLPAEVGWSPLTLIDFVIDPRPRTDGRVHLAFLAATIDVPGFTRNSLLGSTSLGEDGFAAPVVEWRSAGTLRGVAFDEARHGIVWTDRSFFLVLDPDPSIPPSRRSLSAGLVDLLRVAFTGDITRPHLLTSSQNSFYLGDLLSSDLELVENPEILVGVPVTTAHYWTSTHWDVLSSFFMRGFLNYSSRDGWSQIQFAASHQMGDCTSNVDECGLAQPAGIARSISGDPRGWFLAAMSECDGLFLLDVESRCARTVLREGAESARSADSGYFRHVARTDGRALITGDQGRLVELLLP